RVGRDRTVRTLLDELSAAGSFVSINHPAAPDDETCMGCGFPQNVDRDILGKISGLEIVNGDQVEGPVAGWPVWVRLLNAGFHITAIGGSDDHSADETNDRAIGSPATVVYAEALSESALIDGLRRGHAYVRVRGPKGPSLQFEARSGD